jgi:hypothetical protein
VNHFGWCSISSIAGVAAGEPEEGMRKFGSERATLQTTTAWDESECTEEDRDLWLYRDRSIALLKRYVRLAVEIGRLPSLLGREFFRGRVTTYTVSTFEDTVIFVYDMEHSVEKLNKFDQAMIGKIVLEEYSQREAARILNCPLRTIERLFPEALDHLSKILLAGDIMTAIGGARKSTSKICQGGKSRQIDPSSCNDRK